MNMLANIFKPKWQHKRPAIRKQAVNSLNPNNTEQHTILLELSQSDPDLDVRLAAIDRLHDTNALNTLAMQGNDNAIQNQAQTRLVRILSDNQSATLDLAAYTQVIKALRDNTSLLKTLCVNSEDLSYQTVLIDHIYDEATLASLAVESKLTKVRQLAVQRVNAVEHLNYIIKQIRHRDKRVAQIAKDKLSIQRKSQEAQQQHIHECETICDSLELLARSAYNPLYISKLKHLTNQLRSIDKQVPEHLVVQVEQAILQCDAVINEHKAVANEQADEQEHQANSHAEQLSTCDALEQVVAQLKHAIPDELNAGSIHSLLGIQQRRWQEATDQVRAHPKELMRFNKSYDLLADTQAAMERLSELNQQIETLLSNSTNDNIDNQGLTDNSKLLHALNTCLAQINWPPEIAQPVVITKLEAASEAVGNRLKLLEQTAADTAQQLKNAIKKLAKAIDDGNLDTAEKTLYEARKLLANLDTKQRREGEHKINLLAGQLKELQDWKGYATNPKKEELIGKMEALQHATLPLKDKADAIKALQTEWKKLGNTRSGEDKALWARFKAAADISYEPCKAYFADMQARRQFNLEQRQTICQQLETFLAENDWGAPDWKAVDKIINTAKKEWQQFAPVDRKKIKAIQTRFNQVIQPLLEKLNTEKDKNLSAKQALVDEAKALLDSVDIYEAVNQAKALQRRWRAIGFDHRGKGQTLWREYRPACDAIFARLESEQQASEQEQQNNLVVAQEICDKIVSLADSDDNRLSASRKEYDELYQAFKNVGALPSKQRQQIQQQFADCCKRYQQQFAGIARRKKAAAFNELERRATLCQQLEASPTQAMLNQLKDSWSGTIDVPADSAQGIEARWQAAQDLTAQLSPEQIDKNQTNLRLLCIRLEILANMDSPKADEQLRMDYQVKRLSKGLGQEREDITQEIDKIRIAWCCNGSIYSGTVSEEVSNDTTSEQKPGHQTNAKSSDNGSGKNDNIYHTLWQRYQQALHKLKVVE